MPVNQPSEKQRAAARTNGAKSTGPITPAGRTRSSQNSLRHGLRSEVVVLPHEDRSHFEQLRQSYLDSFQPANQPQHDLVETLVASRWRLNRLQEIEAKLFEKEMVLHADEIEKELANLTEVEKLACVFDRMANQGKSLALSIRYEARINRTYEQAFKQLQVLQKTSPPAPDPEIPNEPKPLLIRTLKLQPDEPDDPACGADPEIPESPIAAGPNYGAGADRSMPNGGPVMPRTSAEIET